ncbi:hypothetical protein OLMES_2341 [Oleiphilus messinensis]|uniref:Uncharacterized protein n=1 Tax=Oleiphilus messinensis TaxID=141451 RepID=A0A1Y0IAF4_9GAMM|nr:hypothetical protein [Oleiphilus messinensis]ARU56404.1 hypothetical protein OLMES_2341 [Oleiphilus messinensis]
MKAFSGLFLLIIAFVMGYAKAYWSLFPLSIAFTLAYVHGKWHLWQPLVANKDPQLPRHIMVTWLSQAAVVVVLFGVGALAAWLIT